jgi:hypothetical protein
MTTGSFEIDVTGELLITFDGRDVLHTNGTLISLQSGLKTYSQSMSFVDGTKDWAYVNQWYQSTAPVDQYHQESLGQTIFTRLPQEITTSVDLDNVPTGADIFVGQVKLTRTTSPSHPWFGETLVCKPGEGHWLTWSGSSLIESATGITRLLHMYPESGKLKLKAQQSIGSPMGGYGNRGNAIGRSPVGRLGISTTMLSAQGFPAWSSSAVPYSRASAQDSTSSSPLGAPLYNPHARTGSTPATTVDPTNFTSTYTVDVRGYFGRRS